ncbi:MAG: DUF523 domain-containing protein [Eggerthia catenaformis]|uniref:DUF523 domain-containing protein n=1 Tax=Eggerthia catenaformis TaxID=31973 RepID=UPI0028E59937|nr:DUF523 domain-containing protein [Eggerthia catenaformis]
MRIGISSCLIGICCTYRGDSNQTEWIKKLYETYECVLFCPEVKGGLSIPRDPSEIISSDPLVIKTCHGKNITESFVQGAKKEISRVDNDYIDVFILKKNSPSCGYGHIYDGTFSHTIVNGDGVFAGMLRKREYPVFCEDEQEEFEKWFHQQ